MADGTTQRITIPYWPRSQFTGFHDRSQRWACIVAHRRAGKTVACINEAIRAVVRCGRPNPRIAYLAPTFVQAKDVALQYLKEFTAPIPGVTINESELRADFPNGGRIRLYGADNYDRLRGIYLDGAILDEYADMDPRAYSEVIRPALSDREGWAVFIGTPRGHDGFYKRWIEALGSEKWFALELKASETGILPAKELTDARRDMTEDQYLQEYECSFEAAVRGAFYAEELKRTKSEGRIGPVKWDRYVDVHTAWDLGFTDSTAIIFFQFAGQEIHIIDAYEASGVGLDHYAEHLRTKPYKYGKHYFPHDVEAHELGSGRTRTETLRKLGVTPTVVANVGVMDGINAARRIFDRCWFDATASETLVEALTLYRREFDEKRVTFRPAPVHDWTSHYADAFRYLAVGIPNSPVREIRERYKGKRDTATGSAWAV